MDIFMNEAGETEKCSIGILVMDNVQNEASDSVLPNHLKPVKTSECLCCIFGFSVQTANGRTPVYC